ncbi:CRISPR-associated endonuclease Cas2 [Fibrobacter sp. UWB12]|uniref:CRISPR-associated endonuclease Cas2 n=1 Tax=Fibrobacter sp. UWB12 TaxID=1896203 RepID=UPI00091CC0D3|nr:CRISPR-associated endonuclease Cas2 [Fibrobacter sp. UWB12]SHL00686.1 CRISPR-associated protein, Cas2 family [Fibrobacter sp. UWB12]
MKYLVAFDVCNSRRRREMVKLCLSTGFRVQKSVFESFMEHSQLERFEENAERIIDPETDSVRLYPIDSQADVGIRIVGIGHRIENPAYKVL